MEQLDIIELIENNPITNLSSDYNNKLLLKIKDNFTNFEQHIFLSSFYCYLKYHPTNDFVIDLDSVWKWLGFSQKVNAKSLLEKQFIIDKDYTKSLLLQQKQSPHVKGGQNKEIFMLNTHSFKKFCLKAGTKKADEIHDYYIKMEKLIQEVVNEECLELKKQLEQQTEQLEKQKEITDREKELLVEATLIDQFPLNTQCIYYGRIDNRSLGQAHRLHNEVLIKFGQSNNLAERVKCHKKNFNNFRLVAAFKVKNKIEIENAIKNHPLLKKQIRRLTVENPDYKEENYREILALDDDQFTIEKIDQYIRDIIKKYEYNIENYNLLVDKNNQLEDTIRQLENTIKEKDNTIEKLNKELTKYKPEPADTFQTKMTSLYTVCKYGYYLYAFETEPMTYKCSIVRQKDFDTLNINLLGLDPNGIMRYYTKVCYSFSEKIMLFLMKQIFTTVGTNKFEGTYENVKKVIDISVKLETLLVEKGNHLDELEDILDGKTIVKELQHECPEEPKVRKSKRAIDQINKDTKEVINTYESIEAAGRALGLTTGTAIGIALREKRVCQGFLWRYSGISQEDQYAEQPVIKTCCDTGEKTYFKTIADAAKDANISPPGLRQRILTHVHSNGFHWTFNKNASHYNQKT
jgi:uncharacterized protein YdcH (DUF465 family)